MEKQTNEKKVLVLSFLGVITLIAVVVGATFAYFAAQSGGTGNINVNANTATTDNLSFQVGEAISLTANQEDFGSGMGNKSGSTYARAILTANNATNNATDNYYVYFDIINNDFIYTTEDNQAEMLLKITNPDGNEVTTLDGYNYVSTGGVSGFDITTATGLITIANNYEIVSTGTETQEWTVEIIFVNLDSDQNANTGKSFSAELIIQKELLPTIVADVCPSGGNLANCIINLNTQVGDGLDGIYYHDGVGNYTNANLEASDNSYRYAGINPNNYVCFGSDDEICPVDNLYRIIGVFNGQVKLIKADYANNTLLGSNGANSTLSYADSWGPSSSYKGSLDQSQIYTYFWNNSTRVNTWSESNLNIINLNTNFLSSMDTVWSDLISQHDWIVGGNTYQSIYQSNSKSAYQSEIMNPAEATTYSAKIGLMYVSDYYYSARPMFWSYPGYSSMGENYDYRAATNNNWLYMGLIEWAISRNSGGTTDSFAIFDVGRVNSINVGSGINAVRPCFYLENTVEFSSGIGTQTDPYRIVI